MKTTQQLKQQIFKEVQSSGLFKQVQSKLKTQVLNLVDKQTNPNKKTLGFQYEHPLLNKLRKYPLTSLCLDLIQEFLESFKFKYTLSVFKKQINRDENLERLSLANSFKIEMNNPESQAVLLTLVSQLVSGDIKINQNKPNNAFAATNKNQPTSSKADVRINNFMGTQKNTEPTAIDFNKKSSYSVQDTSLNNNSLSNSNQNDKSKFGSSLNNSLSQEQKPTNLSSKQSDLKPSSILDSSLKPSENSVSQPSKELSEVKQPENDDKSKKGKKKKEVQKPPEGATDLMGELMSKFKTKDNKAQEEVKKNKIFEEKRAFSEQKAKKVLDPSESGTNKIRGLSTGKVSTFMSKFMPASMIPPKNDSYIEEDMDQFQQSKDSTRKNPLYSSSESGFDKSGYYDMSVDSNAINDFQYVEKAKKFTKNK